MGSRLLAQGYVAVVVATSLLMAAMTAERERTTDELRRAAAEITRRNDELERERARLDEAQRIAHLGSWQWDITTDRVQWSDEMLQRARDFATHERQEQVRRQRVHDREDNGR